MSVGIHRSSKNIKMYRLYIVTNGIKTGLVSVADLSDIDLKKLNWEGKIDIYYIGISLDKTPPGCLFITDNGEITSKRPLGIKEI